MCAQRRLRSAWASADAQADLSLRWSHRSVCWFCHAAAHSAFLLQRNSGKYIEPEEGNYLLKGMMPHTYHSFDLEHGVVLSMSHKETFADFDYFRSITYLKIKDIMSMTLSPLAADLCFEIYILAL